MLEIRPISLAKANAFVEEYHRHHGKKVGGRFAISCWGDGDILHGVAICANPVGRWSDDGRTLEVSRLCTDGEPNACSILYGACARIAKDMGFLKIQTYILQSESGNSLKASGWKMEANEVGAITWATPNNQREMHRNMRPKQLSLFQEKDSPKELKQRWVKYFNQKGGEDETTIQD